MVDKYPRVCVFDAEGKMLYFGHPNKPEFAPALEQAIASVKAAPAKPGAAKPEEKKPAEKKPAEKKSTGKK